MRLKSLMLASALSLLATAAPLAIVSEALANTVSISGAGLTEDKADFSGDHCRHLIADSGCLNKLRKTASAVNSAALARQIAQDLLDENGEVIAQPETSRSAVIDIALPPFALESGIVPGGLREQIFFRPDAASLAGENIQTPLPAAAPLMLFGILGLGVAALRKSKTQS